MTTTDLVPAENLAALDALDIEAREVAITGMLDNARSWLAHAVETTRPAQDINEFRQFIATAAETSKRLKVSKEIQQDAEVMVRRSERALGQAIRQGQGAGEIRSTGQNSQGDYHRNGTLVRGGKVLDANLSSPTDFFSHGNETVATYAMTDDVTDDEFDEALARAQEEGNVSRANTVRKVREVKNREPRTVERWEHIQSLAVDGYSSQQIASMTGMNRSVIRRGCRERGITIRADEITYSNNNINSDRVLEGVTTTLEAASFSIQQIRPEDLDQEVALKQIDSLTESISALRKAIRTIKESLHV